MRNTIKNVMIVVAVLITSCQVSEKWKSGPRTAQAIIATTAKAKAVGEPSAISTIKQKVSAVQETAQEWQRKATEATRKAASATDNYVRENPWNAVGCAALGCFVLGFLLGRSR